MNGINKILLWIIALLIILNLATIGTVVYRNYQVKKDTATVAVAQGQNPLNGRFFRQELGFNAEQMEVFRSANQEFQPRANAIIYELDTLKNRMFIEINKPKVDQTKINVITQEIGNHHAELKQLTNEFYMKLKTVCDDKQKVKLQNAFQPLFQDNTNTGMGRGGNMHRWRQRHGQGNRNNN